jgi:uncharacterized membrane protein YkoI
MRSLVLVLLLCLTPLADALPARLAAREGVAMLAAAQISLDDAVRRVKAQTGGRVVSATPAKKGGRAGYRIRVVVDDGRVKTFFVDAETGSMQGAG